MSDQEEELEPKEEIKSQEENGDEGYPPSGKGLGIGAGIAIGAGIGIALGN